MCRFFLPLHILFFKEISFTFMFNFSLNQTLHFKFFSLQFFIQCLNSLNILSAVFYCSNFLQEKIKNRKKNVQKKMKKNSFKKKKIEKKLKKIEKKLCLGKMGRPSTRTSGEFVVVVQGDAVVLVMSLTGTRILRKSRSFPIFVPTVYKKNLWQTWVDFRYCTVIDQRRRFRVRRWFRKEPRKIMITVRG